MTATVEEVVAGHADVTPVNRVAWAPLQNATPGLVVFPADNNCQDSTELATPVGAAIDKGNPEFLDWLRAVAAAIQPKLTEEEAAITATMK